MVGFLPQAGRAASGFFDRLAALPTNPAFAAGIGFLSGNPQGGIAQANQIAQTQAAQEQQKREQAFSNDMALRALRLNERRASETDPIVEAKYLFPNDPDAQRSYVEKQRAAKLAAAQGVQSTFTDESGNLIIIKRDGTLMNTGIKERNPYQVADIGGVKYGVNRLTGERIPLADLQETAQNAGTISYEEGRGTALGKASGEIAAEDLPKSEAAARKGEAQIGSRAQRVQLVSDTIDKAIKQSNAFNTGSIAGRNKFATNLTGTLSTIQAIIGFDELQRLRDMSPTGGALGQVSERENTLLQSVLGSIAQSQSEKQLDENLARAKQEIIASWDRVSEAYEKDFGRPYGGVEPSGSDSSTIKKINSAEDYDKLAPGAEYIDPNGVRRRKGQ